MTNIFVLQSPPFEHPPPPPRRSSSDARRRDKEVPIFIEPRRVPPYVGMTFENFRLISVLGRGHFGKVYLNLLVNKFKEWLIKKFFSR